MRSPIPSWTENRQWAPALVCAVCISCAILLASDPGGDYPDMPQGPGVTLDEMFNQEQGVRLTHVIPAFVSGELTLAEAFGEPEDLPNQKPPAGYHLPDHPPLGRLWLGIWHNVAKNMFPPADHPSPFVTACARTGSALAFGITVFLVGFAAARWFDRHAGGIAVLSLMLMPRVFGHAHLAALETVMGLTFIATVIVVGEFWAGKNPPSAKIAAASGFVFGLALLTKIQAVLLPVPIAVWVLLRFRQRGIVPLLIFGLIGLAVFFCGWPWLWLDPWNHFLQYARGATDRMPMNVFYFGNVYADGSPNPVPWHYPLVMFLVTVPVLVHVFGFVGLTNWNQKKDNETKNARMKLLAFCTAFPLVLFSLPIATVYDGTRLFLVVFPCWAMLAGKGGTVFIYWIRYKWGRPAGLAAIAALAATFYIATSYSHPNSLSYYNLVVGGPRGAEALGFEVTYWGDSFTRDFLEEVAETVPEGATIDVAPVLHKFQLPELLAQSPILRNRGIKLRAYNPENNKDAQFLMVFRRRADLPSHLDPPKDSKVLVENRKWNVRLAVLYQLHE
ncbi:MAG: hypothetical protein Tsb009_37730 [Planctomycetaceae bacterium]